MFDGLKEKAVAKALTLFEEDMRVRVNDKIELFKQLKPADVRDDGIYTSLVISPLWLYVKMQSGGALSALQKISKVDIEARFRKGLFLIRNELVHVDGDKVTLDPEFRDKVGPTLIKAFQEAG
jgi:hypothetical protein